MPTWQRMLESIFRDINVTTSVWLSVSPWRLAMYFQHPGWLLFTFPKQPSASNLVILVTSIWGRSGSKRNEVESIPNKIVSNPSVLQSTVAENGNTFVIYFWILDPEKRNSINFAFFPPAGWRGAEGGLSLFPFVFWMNWSWGMARVCWKC